jgi:hypothetical protein
MLENKQITNSLYGGIARHPLLSRAMTLLWLTPVLNTRWVNMETGPTFLGQKLTGPDLNKFRVLPTKFFHPIHYSDRKLFLEHGCYEKSCKHLYPESYGMHLLAQKDTWFTHMQSPNQPTARVATVAAGKKSKDTKRLTELLAAVASHNQAASSGKEGRPWSHAEAEQLLAHLSRDVADRARARLGALALGSDSR